MILGKFWCFSTFGPVWQGNRYRIVLKRSEMNCTYIIYPEDVLSSKSTQSGDRNLGNRPKIANFRSRGSFWPWLTSKSIPYHSETFRYEFYAYFLPRRCVIFRIDGLSQEKLNLEVHRKVRILVFLDPLALVEREIVTGSPKTCGTEYYTYSLPRRCLTIETDASIQEKIVWK